MNGIHKSSHKHIHSVIVIRYFFLGRVEIEKPQLKQP